MNTLLIRGMQGMGDNFYQRPIIEALCRDNEVYLRTAWPQIYEGIQNLKFSWPETDLRTQLKNARQVEAMYVTPPADLSEERLNYVPHHNRGIPIHKALAMCLRMPVDFQYHLKFGDRCPAGMRGAYAVIRPPTVRKEWDSTGRNCKMDAIQYSIDLLNSKGVQTVVVADIVEGVEDYYEYRPQRASVYFERGELAFTEMVEFVRNARIAVSGVGFMAPLCIAVGTPAIIVHGGAGGWNAPALIDAPGQGKLTHVLPDNYCHCKTYTHECDKRMSTDKIYNAIYSILK